MRVDSTMWRPPTTTARAPRRLYRRGWRRRSAWTCLSLCVLACGGAGATGRLRSPLERSAIPGLGSCTVGDDGRSGVSVSLSSERPIAVLVHGNNAAMDSFALLGGALQERGYEVVCFRWKESGRLTTAAHALREALSALDPLRALRITLVGHSMGGLVARRAVTDHEDDAPQLATPVGLITVATPFAGVTSARPCGKAWRRWLSLGVIASVCRRLARGAKWRDIHPDADMILNAGRLGASVVRHVHLVTDEAGHCRRRNPGGSCGRYDRVFSIAEQDTGWVQDPRLRRLSISAGHGAVVGRAGHLSEWLTPALRLLDEAPAGSRGTP